MKMTITKIPFVLYMIVWMLVSSFVQAQSNSSNLVERWLTQIKFQPQLKYLKSDFGTDIKVTTTSFTGFEPITRFFTELNDFSVGIDCNAYPCRMLAPIVLPDAVKIKGYEVNYYDIDPAGDLICGLAAMRHDIFQFTVSPVPVGGGADALINIAGFSSSSIPGAASSDVITPLASHIVDNDKYFYFNLCLQTEDSRITSTKTYWTRAISQAPGTANFQDVPSSHPFYQSIEAMTASGVTGGCGGGKYCPNQPVTRGQMAAFLARALGL